MEKKSTLIVKNLCKSFGKNTVFSDLNFSFNFGCVYRLAGKNGVGKSTFLKILAGLISQDSGDIILNGKKFLNYTNVTYIESNHRSFLQRLTVIENLMYFAALNQIDISKNKLKKLQLPYDLTKILDKKFSDLSQGQMQALSLLRGLINKPQILLLDEAFYNLDNKTKETICSFIKSYAQSMNSLVIVCSHDEDLKINFKATVAIT